jgi:hypothetical protein
LCAQVSHHPTHLYACLRTAGTITAPFASTWCQDQTLPLDSYGCQYQGPAFLFVVHNIPHFLLCARLWYMSVCHACRACTIPLSCLQHNTALPWHCLCDEGRMSHSKWGRLPVDTENSDTPPVLRGPWEKMGKLIFRLSYVLYIYRGFYSRVKSSQADLLYSSVLLLVTITMSVTHSCELTENYSRYYQSRII